MGGSDRICVAFDLDDTLYKEIEFVRSGWRAVADTFARYSDTGSDGLFSVMSTSVNAFDALLALPALKHVGITIEDILDIYRTHHPDISLPDDSFAVLSELKRRNIPLALITDGRSLTQRNKIAALGLDRFFNDDLIIISGETGVDKYSSAPFMLLDSRLEADHYFYVGDNLAKDFFQPNKMGWTTIMLNDTDHVNIHPQDRSKVDPDHWPSKTINKITELLNLI